MTRHLTKEVARLWFISFILEIVLVSGNSTMRAVLYKPGGVENLYIGTVTKPKVEKTKVLIRAHYTAINRADTLQRRGLYPPPSGESDILGLEVAGVIEEIGEECAGKWM